MRLLSCTCPTRCGYVPAVTWYERCSLGIEKADIEEKSGVIDPTRREYVKRWTLLIAAVKMIRSGLHSARYAELSERGAFEMRDAANQLRLAAERLDAVSDAVLLELPQYAGQFKARKVEGPRAA